MTKIDRLQKAVNKAFGDDTTILKCNERYVLVRYSKNGHVEFATLIHNWDSVAVGHYFTAWNVSADDYGNKEFKNVRNKAIADYNNRI